MTRTMARYAAFACGTLRVWPVYPNAIAVIGAKPPSATDWARGISGSFNTMDSPSSVRAWYLKNGCTVKKMLGDPGTTLTCVGDAAVGIAPSMRGGKHGAHNDITVIEDGSSRTLIGRAYMSASLPRRAALLERGRAVGWAVELPCSRLWPSALAKWRLSVPALSTAYQLGRVASN
jgi:hypothetical protein